MLLQTNPFLDHNYRSRKRLHAVTKNKGSITTKSPIYRKTRSLTIRIYTDGLYQYMYLGFGSVGNGRILQSRGNIRTRITTNRKAGLNPGLFI